MLVPQAGWIPIFPGDVPNFEYVASVAPTSCRGTIWAVDANGKPLIWMDRRFDSFVVDRSVQVQPGLQGNPAAKWIVAAVVDGVVGTLQRGAFFVFLGKVGQNALHGYLFRGHAPHMGEFSEWGPGGGSGWLRWEQVFHDRAGNAAAIDFDLFRTHTTRRILGMTWYYHCSGDVADRTFVQPRVHAPGGAKPTGFTLTGNNAYLWTFGGDLALTANEEGAFICQGKTATRIDNGSATISNADSNPNPFPFWVRGTDEPDTIIRFPAITDGEAADRHSAYVLMEEWIVYSS